MPGYRGYSIDSIRQLTILDDIRISADEKHFFKGLSKLKGMLQTLLPKEGRRVGREGERMVGREEGRRVGGRMEGGEGGRKESRRENGRRGGREEGE